MMSKVVAQFKFEAKFNITMRGLVILGKIINGEFDLGNYIRFEDESPVKTFEIKGIDMPRMRDGSLIVGLYLDTIGSNYFDTENEKLMGRVFDIIE